MTKNSNSECPPHSYHDGDTYWVMQPEQIEALASPVRSDLIDRLVSSGEMCVRELAENMGLRPSSLYHHLQKLRAVGLIEEVGSRLTSGRSETLYRSVAPRIRLMRALEEPQCYAPMSKVSAALTRQMGRDFQRGLANPRAISNGPDRNLGVFRLVGRPNAATLEKINAHMQAVAELIWEAKDENAAQIALGCILAPITPGDAAEK